MKKPAILSLARRKSASLLLGVALCGAALLAWSQSWFLVTLTGNTSGGEPIAATGTPAAPAVAALAIAGLATVGAIAISGKVVRTILATLIVLEGIAVTWSAVFAIAAPLGAVESLVTAATGITGHLPVAALVANVTTTAWPWIAAASGALLAALGCAMAVTSRAWPSSAQKYESAPATSRDRSSGPENAIWDWDRLSGGTDPTLREPDPAPGEPDPSPRGPGR